MVLPVLLAAQEKTVVRPDFSHTLITPRLLRDSAHALTFEQVREASFMAKFDQAKTPYLTFGADASTWWIYFTAVNELERPKTLVLWLNRKNFDEFILLHQRPDSSFQIYPVVGASIYGDDRYDLMNGYYVAVTLMPGENKF